MTRRTFLERLATGAAALAGAAVGFPLISYLSAPWRGQGAGAAQEVDLGYAFTLPLDAPRLVFFSVRIRDAWEEREEARSAWVVRTGPGEVTVWSSVCPHLGCVIQRDRQAKQFICPCHMSRFDGEGRVLTGPSPRPMDTLPVRVEGGKILARWERYQAGHSRKMAL